MCVHYQPSDLVLTLGRQNNVLDASGRIRWTETGDGKPEQIFLFLLSYCILGKYAKK